LLYFIAIHVSVNVKKRKNRQRGNVFFVHCKLRVQSHPSTVDRSSSTWSKNHVWTPREAKDLSRLTGGKEEEKQPSILISTAGGMIGLADVCVTPKPQKVPPPLLSGTDSLKHQGKPNPLRTIPPHLAWKKEFRFQQQEITANFNSLGSNNSFTGIVNFITRRDAGGHQILRRPSLHGRQQQHQGKLADRFAGVGGRDAGS